MWKYTPYIMHYASEYYDPEKAHQYYEEHKKLKGRSSTSTSKLSERGKAAAAYVKKQINDERDQKLNEESDRYAKESKNRQEQKAKTIEQHAKVMNQRIESLKAALKRMPEAQRISEAPKIKATIYKLREANKTKRVELENNHRKAQAEAQLKTAKNKYNIREEATSKYETELEKIRQST